MKKTHSVGLGYVLRPLLFLAATLVVLAVSVWYVFADVPTYHEQAQALVHCIKQNTCQEEVVTKRINGRTIQTVEVYNPKMRLAFHYQLSDMYLTVAVLISAENSVYLIDYEARGHVDMMYYKVGRTIHIAEPSDADYEEQMVRGQAFYHLALQDAWSRLISNADKKTIIKDGILPRAIDFSKWKA